jgi:hypothetical protein
MRQTPHGYGGKMNTATFSLFKDMQKELETFFANKSFPRQTENNSKEFSTPNVVIGHLPPKKSSKEDSPSFIIVRPWEGVQGEKNEVSAYVHEVKVGILCCVYSDENSSETEAGYNYITNMIDGVLQVLVSKRYWSDKFFKINKRIEWKVGLTKEQDVYAAGIQEHPFYGAVVIAKFECGALEFPRSEYKEGEKP